MSSKSTCPMILISISFGINIFTFTKAITALQLGWVTSTSTISSFMIGTFPLTALFSMHVGNAQYSPTPWTTSIDKYSCKSIFINFILHLFSEPYFNTDLVTHRSTEHDHVQDNTIAKLQTIWTFGAFKLNDFKGLISKNDMAISEAYQSRVPSWYLLTIDIFVKFL